MRMDLYDRITTLGSGAGGAVYLVRHKKDKKLLALKKIQLDESRKTRTKDAVLKEARILAELRHPHIVTYYDSFFEETSDFVFLCIVQDYCDGGSLEEKIDIARGKDKKFEEGQIMQWFIQMVMAVQYIHSKKILHRDLKTQNIFMTKKEVIKLGDFGIARTLEHTIDKASTCVGTPSYLSPEMCQDIPYNNKSDMWALGCILYEMCAFQPAFDANNLISLFYKIVKCEHAEVPSMYSSDMRTLIDTVLVKEPDKRPSAGSLLSLPYVQEHLNNFITEKEELQQQIQQLKRTGTHSDSPPVVRKRNSGNMEKNKNVRSSGDNDASVSPNLKNNSLRNEQGDAVSSPAVTRILEPKDSGEYSDDFSSSGDEEVCTARRREDTLQPSEDRLQINEDNPHASQNESESDIESDIQNYSRRSSEEEIPEDVPEGSDEDTDGQHLSFSSPSNGERSSSSRNRDATNDIEEYPDDFEEIDSDEECDLEDILTCAKTAVGAELYEDDFDEEAEDLARPASTCRQLIREHCIDTLGEDIFAKIQEKFKSKQQDLDPCDISWRLELSDGTDKMETCYFVNELLGDHANASP
ncbi:uncharacterized protein [Amphiura filiformis]|uniref:uncharacterized protein n=1 Tax=Amphiura filiformis TaxID=82378 RepID=UPI003B20E6B3